MQRGTHTGYRPEIDGLRAVAVLAVIAYHLHGAWLPGGYVGVDVFFVISGFVVTASMASSRAGSLLSFISEFYARRLARILPALITVLVVSAFFSTLFIPNAWLSGLSESTVKFALFGLSNVVMQTNTDTYFAPRAEFNPYTHTWSLGIEEQFYLLAPLLVYFWVSAYRKGLTGGTRIAAAALALTTAMSLAVCIWASQAQPAVAFYFILARLWELALGVLLFLVTYGRQTEAKAVNPQAWVNSLAAWLGVICIAISFVYADAARFPWPWALLPVVGTLLLIGGAQVGADDPVRRLLAAPLPVWLGKRSYSLYLWHWPVFVLMRWTVGLNTPLLYVTAIGTTVILTLLSYRFIELPLRHNAWIEARPQWLRISGFLLLPVIGLVLVTHLFEHPARYSLSTVMRTPVDWYAGARMPYPELGDRQCLVGMEGLALAGGHETRYLPKDCRGKASTIKVHVLGDSHAGMLVSQFEQLGAEEGIAVSVYSLPGCSYLDFNAPMDATHRTPGCLAFTRAITDQTLKTGKPGDIVVLSSLRLQRYGDQWASFDIPDMHTRMYNAETLKLRAAAMDDAKKWLQPFADKQLKVIFTAPTPVFKAPPFRCSDWFNQANPICVGRNQQPRADLEALRKPILDNMRQLGELFPNVHVWDAFALLCPDEVCLTQKDGRPLFFDGDHLSAYGNSVVYPAFKKAILEAR